MPVLLSTFFCDFYQQHSCHTPQIAIFIGFLLIPPGPTDKKTESLAIFSTCPVALKSCSRIADKQCKDRIIDSGKRNLTIRKRQQTMTEELKSIKPEGSPKSYPSLPVDIGNHREPSFEGLQPFLTKFSYPVLITDVRTETIIIANPAACDCTSGYDLTGRPLEQVLWCKEKLNDDETLVYFDHRWLFFHKEPFVWEGLTCHKISLREHSDLSGNDLIETVKNMAAVMVHRFRSPLTGMQGYLDLLRAETGTDRGRKRIETLNNGMEQLNEMLNELELLCNSSPDSDPHPLHLQAVVQETVEDLAAEVKEKIIVRQRGKSKPFKGSRKKVGELLNILITNAVEHLSGSHDNVYIDVESSRKIEVTNFGEPIPDFVKNRMFMPFMTNKAQNMGIGLTQAYLIARDIGATVLLTRNSKEEGIAFTILMPPPSYYPAT